MVLWFLPLAGCVEPFEVDPEIIGTSSLEGTLIVQANINAQFLLPHLLYCDGNGAMRFTGVE